MIGEKVGNYVVVRSLGKGGMGEVFLAEHPQIGRKAAIKVLHQERTSNPAVARRFLVEARSVTDIGHPNVIEIFDFGRTADGRLYYMMELLQGCELLALMRREGAMEPQEVLPYLEQMGGALAAAHARGVVHRDLKPENIFVTETEDGPRVKVLDFGIAKLLEDPDGFGTTAEGMVMGSPCYMAPEQAAGMGELIGPRTDIYALGLVLYTMLAGRPPFEADSPTLLMAKHITQQPPPLRELLPELPEAIALLVQRCLEKDPADRPESVVQVVQSFASALGREVSLRLPAATTASGWSAPDGAGGGPGPGRSTTLRAATGELEPPGGVRPLSRRLLPVLLAAALLAAVGMFLLQKSGPRPAPAAPAVSAAAPRPVSPALPGPALDGGLPGDSGRPDTLTAAASKTARPKLRPRRRATPARGEARAPDAGAAPGRARPTPPARLGEGTVDDY